MAKNKPAKKDNKEKKGKKSRWRVKSFNGTFLIFMLIGMISQRRYYSLLFSAFMITSMWLPLFRSTFLRKSEICSPRRFFTNSL